MRIVIVGAGGHGRVVLDIFRDNHQFDIAGFLDSNTALHGRMVSDKEVLGDISMIPELPGMGVGGAIIAIGDNQIRCNYAQAFKRAQVQLISAIHSSANIAHSASIGYNVVVASGANISTLVRVEDSAILNTGCIVDHESYVGRGVHICPGVRIAGHVTVHESAFVGIGATVIHGVTIGKYAVIGAGSVVLKDVEPHATVVGVPAKPIKNTGLSDPADPSHTAERSLRRPMRQRPMVQLQD